MSLDQPAHLQSIAQPQLLDALIDARDLEFVAQRNLTMRVGEVEPEQVGEILDRLLGARRIRARQRRDRVHAVEQKVRLDPRLKRADPCARLEFDVAAPFDGRRGSTATPAPRRSPRCLHWAAGTSSARAGKSLTARRARLPRRVRACRWLRKRAQRCRRPGSMRLIEDARSECLASHGRDLHSTSAHSSPFHSRYPDVRASATRKSSRAPYCASATTMASNADTSTTVSTACGSQKSGR